MDPLTQLPLALQLQSSARFANFHPGQNQLLFDYAQQFLTNTDHLLFIAGASKSGRSHLLQALYYAAEQIGMSSMYLPLGELGQMSAQMLENMEQYQLLLVDDVDVVAKDKQWQEALFHLYNRVQTLEHKMVFSSLQTPQQLELSLADLKSRLNTGTIFQIQALNEADKSQWLKLLAQEKGFVLTEEVVQYLLRRLPRDMNSLLQAMNTLDQASLAAKRKITIPFVKEALQLR